MGFLDNYEDVNARIKRFRSEFPTGRLVAYIEDMDLAKGTVLIRAEAYREYEDHVPSAIDYAYGNVATLANNMKRWLIEDTTTSAYGRVIGLLTPSTLHNARPTVQDMQQVESLPADSDPWATLSITQTAHETKTTALATAIEAVRENLGGQQVAEAPLCTHGHMIWSTGTSAKTGKDWAAYRCPQKAKAEQCAPRWYVYTSRMKWEPQV